MNKELYVEAGKRIRTIRENNKYTRDYVAYAAQISSKFLYEIEHGEKGFSADVLFKISKALNVSSEYILSGTMVTFEDREIVDALSLFTSEQLKEIVILLKNLHSIFNR